MKRIAFFVVAVCTAGPGCSSNDNSCSEAGCVSFDGSSVSPDTGPDAQMLWGLSRGMNNYNVTAIADVTDGCSLKPAMVVGTTLPVTYNDVTTVISIGSMDGTPVGPSLGSGMVGANMATLIRENTGGDTGGCTWHQKDTGMLKLFDNDKFTLSVKEDESAFMNCTNPPPPTGGTCTSTWTWTLQKAM